MLNGPRNTAKEKDKKEQKSGLFKEPRLMLVNILFLLERLDRSHSLLHASDFTILRLDRFHSLHALDFTILTSNIN